MMIDTLNVLTGYLFVKTVSKCYYAETYFMRIWRALVCSVGMVQIAFTDARNVPKIVATGKPASL